MSFGGKFPPLYPILDAAFLPPALDQRHEALGQLTRGLTEAGVEILQYRSKQGSEAEILNDAESLRAAATPKLKLILNDFPHLAVKAGFDGVHVGQQDLPPRQARALLGAEAIVGVSIGVTTWGTPPGHNP